MSQQDLTYCEDGIETLLPEIKEEYLVYARMTWNSVNAMTYNETGLPADQLHHDIEENIPTGEISRIDKTSPTNIGFYLASFGAAHAMGFISDKELDERMGQTISTIIEMTNDPEIFIETSEGKGLFVNWIQPSTGKLLKQWPGTDVNVKQQISTVDMAWLVTFSKMIAKQYPQHAEYIDIFLNKMDLPYMFNPLTGFFYGCYNLKDQCFEPWEYDVLSEARIAYLICGDGILEEMGKLINRKNERCTFEDPNERKGRRTWDGEYFTIGWPYLVVPEDRFSPQWRETIQCTIEAQRRHGELHNNGHYGYSAGLGPNGQYYEYRVPETGESTAEYIPQTVVTVSALLNMAIIYPLTTYKALERLHMEFPRLTHPFFGDGDTINTQTGDIQRDQLLPNQATSLISCWNVVLNEQPRNIFVDALPTSVASIYQKHSLL